MLNELLKQKFTSDNDVPVTSIRITRAEYEQALQAKKFDFHAAFNGDANALEKCSEVLAAQGKLLDDAMELLRHFTDFPEEDFAGEENFPYTMSVWMNKLRQAREVIAAYDLNKSGGK